jgi:hypothetical protein
VNFAVTAFSEVRLAGWLTRVRFEHMLQPHKGLSGGGSRKPGWPDKVEILIKEANSSLAGQDPQ